MTHQAIMAVTQRIEKRSEALRQSYLDAMTHQQEAGRGRSQLSCGNLAHAVATAGCADKQRLLDNTSANLAIISSYNDMLSAHKPYEVYPEQIQTALAKLGHTAQVAGCVPAMCDGVTQGQPGMDMSLFSRDLIAQSTAFSLSHNMFDGNLLLGVCDKIAPGQLMGALAYGHLPTAFIPAGPMTTGISNDEKVSIRQQYAAGNLGQMALLDMECRAYHGAGTCTFFGTANTNQLVFEAMGLMLPGSAFIAPHDPLRRVLTEYAALVIASSSATSPRYRPLYEVFTAKNLVNGLVALLASGGSTNHSIHMIAVARAAGYILTWQDLSDLADAVPLVVNIYPNGSADINDFQAAGGVPAMMTRLAQQDLLHQDTLTAFGHFNDQLSYPALEDGDLVWRRSKGSSDSAVIANEGQAFQSSGGLKVLKGNLGQAVIKVSAVKKEHRVIEGPAKVFNDQNEVERAYQSGELNCDCIVVVRFNGPAANGMPELHKLMPLLGNLQNDGFKVALVTDGRLSGASGKIPAAIHVSPEALRGGVIAKIKEGDIVRLDSVKGCLEVLTDLDSRTCVKIDNELGQMTWGRGLFAHCRQTVSAADQGASFLYPSLEKHTLDPELT
ncbi:phosphogluconate dehydratase [Vibrio maritimus]|uniref:phosphogluconate dehydratase n=1 Tax=Vibrio maritimus TaxID=990268 RepID=UPI003734E1D9